MKKSYEQSHVHSTTKNETSRCKCDLQHLRADKRDYDKHTDLFAFLFKLVHGLAAHESQLEKQVAHQCTLACIHVACNVIVI